MASLGVNASKPSEFHGFGEMHPVYSCGLIGCECNQTIEFRGFGEILAEKIRYVSLTDRFSDGGDVC